MTHTVNDNTFRDSKTAALTINKANGTGTIDRHEQQQHIGVRTDDRLAQLRLARGLRHRGHPLRQAPEPDVTGNTIRQYNSTGMRFIAGAGTITTGNLNLDIENNTIAEPGVNPSTRCSRASGRSGVTSPATRRHVRSTSG